MATELTFIYKERSSSRHIIRFTRIIGHTCNGGTNEKVFLFNFFHHKTIGGKSLWKKKKRKADEDKTQMKIPLKKTSEEIEEINS